jgi:hypothetical protein
MHYHLSRERAALARPQVLVGTGVITSMLSSAASTDRNQKFLFSHLSATTYLYIGPELPV